MIPKNQTSETNLTVCSCQDDSSIEKEEILQTEEIVVEEMAIDGICGVY